MPLNLKPQKRLRQVCDDRYSRASLPPGGNPSRRIRRSFGELVIKSLEQILKGPRAVAPAASMDAPLFTPDEFGFPVLNGREGVFVTEALINRIRQEEGI